MVHRRAAGIAGIFVFGIVFGTATVAAADANDLVLSRLGQIDASGTGVIPSNADFRSLVSELGVVIAPRFLTPADTLGFSGFQFSTEIGYTSINNSNHYWCATEESANCADGFQKSSTIQTVSLFARKGIWLPLPSFEIGAGALHVADSRIWAAQAYAKMALHEGYHDWAIPSVAVRFAGSRMMGSEQLDLTVASLDLSLSKRFAVAGTFTITPFGGWNILWIIPRSEVIDKTPNVAVKDTPNDIKMNFVFPVVAVMSLPLGFPASEPRPARDPLEYRCPGAPSRPEGQFRR